MNAALCELLGSEPHALVGRSVLRLVAAVDRGSLGAAVRELRSSGHLSATLRLRTPQGSEISISVSVVDLGESFYGVYRDLSRARLQEDALRDAEGLVAALLAGSPDAISVVNSGGGVLRANAAFADVVGTDARAAIGHQLIHWLPQADTLLEGETRERP